LSLFEFVYFSLKQLSIEQHQEMTCWQLEMLLKFHLICIRKIVTMCQTIANVTLSLYLFGRNYGMSYMYYFFMISLSGIFYVQPGSCTSPADFGKDILTI